MNEAVLFNECGWEAGLRGRAPEGVHSKDEPGSNAFMRVIRLLIRANPTHMPVLFLLTSLASPAHAFALLVTMTSGSVQLDKGDGPKAVTGGGFALLDGHRLTIAKGASAVVLFPGGAQQVAGPREITTADVFARTDGGTKGSALASVLDRKSSTATVGASRGAGGFALLRPVEGASLVRLHEMRWSCDGCPPFDLTVIDLATFGPVWSGTGSGTGAMPYGGPPLAPGDYAVQIDDKYLAFKVVTPSEGAGVAKAATEARALARSLPSAAQTAVEAAVWAHVGMSTEALHVIDRALAANPTDAGLRELMKRYETAAGLPH